MEGFKLSLTWPDVVFREVGVLHQQLHVLIGEARLGSLSPPIEQSGLPLESSLNTINTKWTALSTSLAIIFVSQQTVKIHKNTYKYILLRISTFYIDITLFLSPGYRRRSLKASPASWTFLTETSLWRNTRIWCWQRRLHPPPPLHCPRGQRGSYLHPQEWSSSSRMKTRPKCTTKCEIWATNNGSVKLKFSGESAITWKCSLSQKFMFSDIFFSLKQTKFLKQS